MDDVFDAVMGRLKTALSLSNDKELAEALGLKPNAFYNRRKMGSPPYEHVLQLIEDRQLSADWVFFGIGSPFRDKEQSTPPVQATVETEAMQEICYELERAFAHAFSEETHGFALQRASMRGGLAALIYHRILGLPGGPRRREVIRREAKAFAEAAAIAQHSQDVRK